MARRLDGKVALITGAARGQGRSHAVRLAQEGAKIIAVDICEQIDSVNYPIGTPEDLAETVRLVESAGGEILPVKGDVRERSQMADAVSQGLKKFGKLDILCTNAGICAYKHHDMRDFIDSIDVDLIGVMNALSVSLPHMKEGSSVIITGSTAGLMPDALKNPMLGPGGPAYAFAKKTLADYVEVIALQLAPQFIRVNGIHPTNCNTNLLHNSDIYSVFRPDLANPTVDDVMPAFMTFQAMPIPYVEPVDISNAVLFFASEESRYVTGINLRVDAGAMLKYGGMPQG